MENKLSNIRTGRVTSGEIVDLMSNGTSRGSVGAPFKSYVEACIMERFFKAPSDETSAEVFHFHWGKLCERIVHELLGTEYVFQSDVTLMHPELEEWVGTPDGLKSSKKLKEIITVILEEKGYKILQAKTVTDIKCPTSKKGFYNLVRDLYIFDGVNVTKREKINGNDVIKMIRDRSKEGKKYYWQLVSNACITGAEYAELIVYMPYFEELQDIKLFNTSEDGPGYYTIERKTIEELPYLMKETGIDNLNIIRFKVPEEDKKALRARVELAIDEINQG